ncbi:MAG: FAD-dependent oxidoreductase, partial [Proteiniphilum sp.]|nr:FAD-dependent oxidoreductase [Proteiniphilum sp.]
MDRRSFITYASILGGSAAIKGCSAFTTTNKNNHTKNNQSREMNADVIILGGGMGGVATALACCRNGLSVIMTEETDWIGGQVSQQGVPPDEHPWIETHGAPPSYREYRNRVRDYYRRNYPLTEKARQDPNLNPGNGSVSRLCHEPRVTVAVMSDMLAPYMSTGKLLLLTDHKATSAVVSGDNVRAVEVQNLRTGDRVMLSGSTFVDATECGDLLPLTGTEYTTGTESKSETRELHAPEKGDPMNNQAFTVCFAMDYQPGIDNVQDPPKNYTFWKNYIPEMTPAWSGRLLDLSYSDPRTLKPKRLGFDPTGKELDDVL